MQLWTFLHILSMFTAVTILIGSEWWGVYAARSRDLPMLRAYFRIARNAERLGQMAFVAGVIFGLIAAVTGSWDLLRGWLVLAYLLVAATIIFAGASAGWIRRMRTALEANEGDVPGPELEAYLGSPRLLATVAIDALLIALIIWDMVFKPAF